MALEEIEWALGNEPLPATVVDFLAQAQVHMDAHYVDAETPRIPGFAPSNYHVAWRALDAMRSHCPAEARFCEWGSGFGIVTCLAAMLGYRAVGIELEPSLVDAATALARAHDIEAEFRCASYRDDAGTAVERTLVDCDLVYAYPWPAEESYLPERFAELAASGTFLLTYHGGGRLQARRQT